VLRAAEGALPANFFVYVFVAGFLGGAVAMLGQLSRSRCDRSRPARRRVVGRCMDATALMLAFAEATLTGMLITLRRLQTRVVGTFRTIYLTEEP
jgi:uncharacterized membrane protein